MKSTLRYSSNSEEETQALGGKILSVCKNQKIFAIFGELGAGKTALVKAFCQVLKVEDNVHSPTFSLVNEYHYPDGKVFHFDFYRIRKIEEAYDMGFEEYLDSGSFCFIEWPEEVSDLIPSGVVQIFITAEGETRRKFEIEFEDAA